MIQEDKYLLLLDICARLPHGVIGAVPHYDENGEETLLQGKITGLNNGQLKFEYLPDCDDDIGSYNWFDFDLVKPYLRPMSSMTEEEKEELLNHVIGGEDTEYFHITHDGSIDGNQEMEQDLFNFNLHWINFGPLTTSSYIDWLNMKMFDYRGLIPKGHALSTETFNPYKD